MRGDTVDESQLLFKPKEAAAMLSVSPRTLWGLRDLARVRFGRSVRYSATDLAAWVAKHRSGGASDA